jgi:hypothetical protein
MKDQDKNRGWYEKYIIEKTDGAPVDPNADYFVLRLDTDKNARQAILKYAECIKEENPKLAENLKNRVDVYESLTKI